MTNNKNNVTQTIYGAHQVSGGDIHIHHYHVTWTSAARIDLIEETSKSRDWDNRLVLFLMAVLTVVGSSLKRRRRKAI